MLEKILKIITCGAMLLLLLGCVMALSEDPQNTQVTIEETGIPRIYLDGNVLGMWNKQDVQKISVEYHNGPDSFFAYAKVNMQGASSLEYNKKNYTVKFFFDEACTSRKRVDFGWGPQSQYCLKANWIDKTHARNIVSARLAAEVQAKYGVLAQAPNYGVVDGFPVEVYANGKFLGLYTLNIPRDAWMLGMDKENPSHLAFMSYNWNDGAIFEALPDYDSWEIEVGEQNEENLQKLARLFTFVMESSDAEFREKQPEYFDLDAALHYIILCEFALMEDNAGKNMILATYDGKVWYPSLYDMDSSWGADWSGRELFPYTYPPITPTSNFLKRVKDVFTEELVQRYFALREEILTKEHVMELFEAFREEIPASTWEKEQELWKDIPGYDYDQIEEFLDVRIPHMDNYMRGLLEQKAQ